MQRNAPPAPRRHDVARAHPTPRRHAGFTLIESGIVLAVVAVLAGLAAPSLRDTIDARRLQGASSTVASDLRFVRAEAAARRVPLRFSVRPLVGGTCYVIHTGPAVQCDCAGTDGPARCLGDAVALRTVRFGADNSVALQANVASMLYDPARGTTTPTGTLRVVGRSGRAIHHVVNLLGRARSCSPTGVAGLPAC